MLNKIWTALFLVAFITAIFQYLALDNHLIFQELMEAIFTQAKTAFQIAIGLTGVLSFWLGIMKIGEKSGFVNAMTHILAPLMCRLMPNVPPQHPALGSMVMNMSANMLGLDNAATPMGIKAMKELQTLNPNASEASNDQILFLVINTSSVTLLPITIFTYRAQLGATDPTDVFIPILVATYCSTITGLLAVAWIQKINLLNRIILLYLAGFTAIIVAILTYFSSLDRETMLLQSAEMSHLLLFSLIIAFIVGAIYSRINAYEAFIEGAKDGFQTAVTIIPFLVAMLVAIGVFRASGTLDYISEMIKQVVRLFSLDDQFVDALPTALIKPFSGSGARALMIESMQNAGPDSLVGRLVCVVQGSTETTFYVLTVYFGAVGIKNIRHAAMCGIMADLGGIIAAILVTYWFF